MNGIKPKEYLGAPKLKENGSEYSVEVTKNIQCFILLCFGGYTPTQYALSCKILKF